MIASILFRALRHIFSMYDKELTGFITPAELLTLLNKYSLREDNTSIAETVVSSANAKGVIRISFQQFLMALVKSETEHDTSLNVIKVLKILEEHRKKCVQEGDYLRAENTLTHIKVLFCFERDRRKNIIKSQQMKEKMSLRLAHDEQFLDFNKGMSLTSIKQKRKKMDQMMT